MTASPIDVSSQRVAIILVNWNSWQDSVDCLDTLFGQRHERFHIFVIDNHSSDGSVERIVEWCSRPRLLSVSAQLPGVHRLTDLGASTPAIPVRVVNASGAAAAPMSAECRLTLVRSGANRGFAGGCNVGLDMAGHNQFDYFWLLNTDTVVHSDALKALLRRAISRPQHGLLGSTLRYYDTPQKVQALAGSRLDVRTATTRHIGEGIGLAQVPPEPDAVESQLAHICGASMLASSRFVRDVGPMQEDYFLYYEEYDWAMRGRQRYSLGYAPDSHVFHKSGASSSKIMPIFTSRLYYRNRIRFTSRFFPEHMPTIKRGLAVELLRQLCKRRWRVAGVLASALWDAGRLSEARQTHATSPQIGVIDAN